MYYKVKNPETIKKAGRQGERERGRGRGREREGERERTRKRAFCDTKSFS